MGGQDVQESRRGLEIMRLNELHRDVVQDAVKYHIENNIPFRENIFRPGTQNFFRLFNEARRLYEKGLIKADWEDIELFETDIGTVINANEGKIALDLPFEDLKELEEAEYRGKKVKLNSPKRGGSKKYYVYTKNKKGNVIKVSWGDTTGLSTKAKNPGAVKSFVARHQCHKKNDKTKAGYWACRTPRYKSLGVKGGQWW
jgi:hypothetical protein